MVFHMLLNSPCSYLMVPFGLISILQQKLELMFLSPAPSTCHYLDHGNIHRLMKCENSGLLLCA